MDTDTFRDQVARQLADMDDLQEFDNHIQQEADMATQTPAAPTTDLGIHIHQRPSRTVLGTALAYLTAGWAGLITKTAPGHMSVPTSSGPQTYEVTMAGPDRITCTCPAGAENRHCWHVTTVQLITGLSRFWGPEQRLVPYADQANEEPGEGPEDPMPRLSQPATPAAAAGVPTYKARSNHQLLGIKALTQELAAHEFIQASPKVLRLEGQRDFGILSAKYAATVAEFGEQKAFDTTTIALADTHIREDGSCTCGEPLKDFGTNGSICWECGLIVPRQKLVAVAA